MSGSGKIPYFKVSGTPEEIGYQHGHQLRDRVRACYTFYKEHLFLLPDAELREHGRRWLDLIGEKYPDYRREIEGIATGSGLQPWEITLLNARTELHNRAYQAQMANECTAVYSARDRIIGENWDWMRQCEDLIAILDITREDGHRILMLAEPGIIGKIGLNSAGLGVCLNIIHGQGFAYGIPIHVLLRVALDASSIDRAREDIRNSGSWTFSNILLGDREGRSFSLELKGADQAEVGFDGPIIHTNHYLAFENNDQNDPLFENSSRRLARAETIISAHSKNDGQTQLETILLDRENSEDAICAPYKRVLHFDVGTVATIIMDLRAGSLRVSDGNPIEHGFRTFSLG